MQQQDPNTPADPPVHVDTLAAPGGRRISRRAAMVGSVIALLVAVGLGWLAWSLTQPATDTSATAGAGARGGAGRSGPGGRGGPATTVGVAAAESADIPVVLDALGTVVPQATVRVRPQVTGVLLRVLFKEGQMVNKGDLLAEIDPRSYQAVLQQAIGARQRDEAQLQAARVLLQRYQTLLQQDSIARQDVDTQAAQVRQLEASIVSDRANEAAARLNLAYTRIVAPISGRVGLRTVDVGNVVSPSDTNGVALITQLTPIDVEFALPQDHASWLQHNAGAYMEVQAFDRTRTTLLDTGVFASLDNQIDVQTGTVKAKARFNNARQQLFPSQFVNIKLQLRTIRNAVVVPVAALRQGGTGEYVFVLQDNRTVQLRPVVRGQAMGDKVQITSGLQIGEKVITEGADRLRDGSRVVLPGDAPMAPGEGRRRRGANAPQPAASAPFTGASAAQASPPPSLPPAGGGAGTPSPAGGGQGWGQQASNPFAPASAMMGAGRGENLTPEEREARRQRFEAMTPEERAAMRERRAQRRAAAASAPAGPTQ
jgi:multidrug efflux system membrane fusion protein